MLARRTVPSPIVTDTFCCSTTSYWAGSGDQACAVPLNSAADATTVSATPRPSLETSCLRIRTPALSLSTRPGRLAAYVPLPGHRNGFVPDGNTPRQIWYVLRPGRYRSRPMAATDSLFLYSVRAPRNWDEAANTGTLLARARICEAMAHLVAERGYAAVTVADVVSSVRISRRTFYEHFEDKESCFLETYRIGCENGIAQIDDALRALDDPDWRTRLRVSLEAYVSILAHEPHFARVLLIDVLGAGPRALAMREQVLAEYVAHY